MALFFRKSVKAGPVRLNFSKNGIGWSFGNKFVRIGRSATGRSYVSGGANGVYYRENLTSGKRHAKRTTQTNNTQIQPKQEFTATGFFLTIGITAIFCGLFLGLLAKSWTLFFILFGTGIGILLLMILLSSNSGKQENGPISNDGNNDIDLSTGDPKVAAYFDKTDKLLEILNEPLEEIPTSERDERIDITAENNNKGIEYESNNE